MASYTIMSDYDNGEYNKRWRVKHQDVYRNNSVRSNAKRTIRDSKSRISKLIMRIEALNKTTADDELDLKYREYQILLLQRKINELICNITKNEEKLETMKTKNSKVV